MFPDFDKISNMISGMDIKKGMMTYILFGPEGFLQRSLANKLGSVEKQINELGVTLGAQDFSPFGSVKYWDNIYSTIKDANQQLGVAGGLGRQINQSFVNSLPAVANIGGEWKDVASSYQEFISAYGRNVALTSDELLKLTEIKVAFKEGAAEMAAMMKGVGVGIIQTTKDLGKLAKDADKIGANFSVVLKELKENMGALNRFSFAKGRLGLMDMAKYAQQTKISMSTALGFADKIWEGSIEGAIDTASQLQMLGGEFAQFGDPFEMLYLARNAPEELQKRIGDITSSMASFNSELGEVVVDPLGMSQIREFADITGMKFEELVKSAKDTRKQLEISDMVDVSLQGDGFKDRLTKIAGAAEFDTGLGEWVVKFEDGIKTISQITEKDLSRLSAIGKDTDQNEVFNQLILSNETLTGMLQRLIDVIKLQGISSSGYNRLQNQPIFDDIRKGRADISRDDFGGILRMFNDLSKASIDNFINNVQKLPDMAKAMKAFFDETIIPTLKELSKLGEPLKELFKEITDIIVPLLPKFIDGLSQAVKMFTFLIKKIEELIVGIVDIVQYMKNMGKGGFFSKPTSLEESISQSLSPKINVSPNNDINVKSVNRPPTAVPISSEEDIRIQKRLTSSSSNDMNINLSGTSTIKLDFPDNTTREIPITEEMKNYIVNHVKSMLTSENMNGGKSDGSTGI